MKRLLIAGALLIAVSGIARADDDDRDDRRGYQTERYEAQREYQKDRYEARREAEKDRRDAEREYLKDRREAAREYDKDRKEALKDYAKAERKWARGGYIPRQYLDEPYYVRDYRLYDLAPPPRGYTWVRPDPRDDQYYLVQMATGVISQFLGR